MNRERRMARLRSVIEQPIPLAGCGQTNLRFQRLIDVGREDLSLARLAEAHWDAVAILSEAGRTAKPNTIYGVWASETSGCEVRLESVGMEFAVHGVKMFCSGAGLVDRALVTADDPAKRLVDIDLGDCGGCLRIDNSEWKTSAFVKTNTATVTFAGVKVERENILGEGGWYLSRTGFWIGACSPAACWAGGAIGLSDCALERNRRDPHTLAHLAAMRFGGLGIAWILRAGRTRDR